MCKNVLLKWEAVSKPGGDAAVGVGGGAAVDALVAGADLADEQRHGAARWVERDGVLGTVRHVVRVCRQQNHQSTSH